MNKNAFFICLLALAAATVITLAGCDWFGSDDGNGGQHSDPATFIITATAGANGAINPGGNITVNYGSDQIFTFTPADNYMVETVIVDGTAIATTGDTYTFVNVTSDHTINVTFIVTSIELKASWSKTYGHGDTYTEYHTYGFDATSDGGYVFAAQSVYNGAGTYDFWIVRLDSEGNIVWERGFGGTNEEEPFAVRQTSDGGFIIAGESSSFRTGASNSDAWVIKLTGSGTMEWQYSYGDTDIEAFHDVKETSDDEGDSTGFLLCGYTTSFGSGGRDVWIVKISNSSSVIHETVVGGSGNEFGRSVALTPDGGCIVLADTQSFGAGDRDVWLIKLDSDYDVEWEKAYGGSDVDFPRNVVCADDGGYVVGAYTESFGAGGDDFWIMKVDADGDLVWQYTYGGLNTDIAHDLQKTGDGGYIMTGWTSSFGDDSYDAWVVKLNGSGLIQWQKRYNITYNDGSENYNGNDWAYRIVQTADGGYAVAGDSDDIIAVRNGDVWVFKVDSTGALGCDMAADTNAVGNGTAAVAVTDTSGDSSASSTSATVSASPALGYNASPEILTQCKAE